MMCMLLSHRPDAACCVIEQEPQPFAAFIPPKGFLWLDAQKTLYRLRAGELFIEGLRLRNQEDALFLAMCWCVKLRAVAVVQESPVFVRAGSRCSGLEIWAGDTCNQCSYLWLSQLSFQMQCRLLYNTLQHVDFWWSPYDQENLQG